MTTAKHPPPWRWEPSASDPNNTAVASWLVDADGQVLVSSNTDEDVALLSPVVRELIRIAPEMEAAIRGVEWSVTLPDTAGGSGCCPECESRAGYGPANPGDPHAEDCSIGTVLAALDAARRATP